jgi:polar amino acid transport system permease protein
VQPTIDGPTDARAPLTADRANRTRREAYERSQRLRSAAIAAVSTIVVVGLVVWRVPKLSGWPKVRKSFFDGERFTDAFPGLLRAFVLDVKIFAWTAPCILAAGLLIAMARLSRNPVLFPVRIFAVVYTDAMRGIPVILWIYLVGFGVPGLGLDRPWNSPLIWGSVALGMTYSAYVAEVFRAGILSVHESQRAAARSLGLSTSQTMRHVVLPQGFRRVVPPLMNDLVSLQKDVALVSLIGPIEILRQAGIYKSKFANFTPYVAAAVIFVCLTVPFTRLTDWLLARQQRRTGSGAVR